MTNDISLTGALQRLQTKRLEIRDMVSLGAGSGKDSLFIRNKLCPDAALLMVEAQSDHERSLVNLAKKAGASDYIICAATERDETVEFTKGGPTGGAVAAEAGDGTVKVPGRSVDSLVSERGLEGPFFLKFDTHGVELDILKGASATLQKTSLIMMEVYNFKLNFVEGRNLTFYEMCAHLETKGFRCVDLCNPLFRPNDGVFWQAHLFFISASHPVFRSNSYSAPPPFDD